MFEQLYENMFSEPIVMEKLDFNPIIYNNEPYSPPEYMQDILDDYLDALNILREEYIKTKDEKYARLLLDLVPADVYWRYD